MSVACFIADHRTFYRVPHAVTCAILGVSVSWFYKWVDREPTDRQRRRAELDARCGCCSTPPEEPTARHASMPTCSPRGGGSA